MSAEVKVPRLAESSSEATLVEWLKADGAAVRQDEPIATLETDKAKLQALQQQAAVQLARLGGNPDLPVEQHPQYLQARAQADEAQRQIDHTIVRAPFDGVATQVDALQRGTYLVAQTAALTNTGAIGLVATRDVWVDANMKETDLTHVKPGDRAEVYVDTYPGRAWSGTVQTIAPAAGSEFSILPAQNSSGNWVKVVQRVPVRLRNDYKPGDPVLRAGMSVVVAIFQPNSGKMVLCSILAWML